MPPKAAQPLTAVEVDQLRKPGLYCDGGSLYLRVSAGGKSWMFRWRDRGTGKLRDMGLGSYNKRSNTLANARERAAAARKQLIDGLDPLTERDRARAERRVLSTIPTFDECAEQYISAHSAGWSNPKHIEQWRSTLRSYASPIIGKLPVNDVTSEHVLKIIRPIWTTKTETASRVRGRVESVLDWAASPTRAYRSGDNPARWRGHLDKELARPAKVGKRRHHPALDYAHVAAFMAELRKKAGQAARCLEFTILTACRTNETIKAQWDEFDISQKIWRIPRERMKIKATGDGQPLPPHRVPLAPAALGVLKVQRGFDDVFVFPGDEEGASISNMAMLELLRGMGKDFTVHGFRSTFRDWTAETTNTPHEVAEMALAHAIGDKTEAAYRRGDLFEKRRKLMADWSRYATGKKRG